MLTLSWHHITLPVNCFWRAVHMKRGEAYQRCFRILGVSEKSDQDTVRRAYIELVKKVHPDSGCDEASVERFQEVDGAFKMLQEKFAKNRRNIIEDDEESIEYDIRHTAPQHRQYLSYDGVGVGTPFQRQKQYQQVKAMKAQDRVLQHRIDKSAASDQALMKKGGQYYGKHAIKTKYGIERVVEDLIQEAMSKGDFNNLSGAGKPLSSAQTQNPYLDFTTHKLNKIMLDNGFTPEWITLNRDIRESAKALKAALSAERIYYGEYPLTSAEACDWEEFVAQHELEAQQINKLIDKYNLIVPVLENQFFRLNLQKIADNVLQEKDLKRNVKRPVVTASNTRPAESDHKTNLFALFDSLL